MGAGPAIRPARLLRTEGGRPEVRTVRRTSPGTRPRHPAIADPRPTAERQVPFPGEHRFHQSSCSSTCLAVQLARGSPRDPSIRDGSRRRPPSPPPPRCPIRDVSQVAVVGHVHRHQPSGGTTPQRDRSRMTSSEECPMRCSGSGMRVRARHPANPSPQALKFSITSTRAGYQSATSRVNSRYSPMWLSIEHGTRPYSRTMWTTRGEYSSSASAASGATRCGLPS